MNRWELEKKIVIKALKDPTFKKQLLLRPNETVREFLKNENEFDFSRFAKINFLVVEEKREEWILALPWLQEGAKALSDAELEQLFAGVCSYYRSTWNCD